MNDIYLFTAVVTHKGFSTAAGALHIPMSRLSKRVPRLEEPTARTLHPYGADHRCLPSTRNRTVLKLWYGFPSNPSRYRLWDDGINLALTRATSST